jgi:hypothetical protein
MEDKCHYISSRGLARICKLHKHHILEDLNLSYDLDKGFDERIMVYSMYKLGKNYLNELLRFSTLSDIVKTAYWSARSRLPSYYIGIHTRISQKMASKILDKISKTAVWKTEVKIN